MIFSLSPDFNVHSPDLGKRGSKDPSGVKLYGLRESLPDFLKSDQKATFMKWFYEEGEARINIRYKRRFS